MYAAEMGHWNSLPLPASSKDYILVPKGWFEA